jgi:hypothetical protein
VLTGDRGQHSDEEGPSTSAKLKAAVATALRKGLSLLSCLTVGVVLLEAPVLAHPERAASALSARLQANVANLARQVLESSPPGLRTGIAGGRSTQPAPGSTWMNVSPDGTPVRWDPCQTINYVLNVSEAPAGSTAEVAHALTEISAAAGLHFAFDGYTSAIPTKEWPTTQYKQYRQFTRDTYPPVLIAWAYKSQTHVFDPPVRSNVVAMTGPQYVGTGMGEHYVTGEGVIDAAYASTLQRGFGAGTTQGELLLHELSHIVGLGESTNPANISYEAMIPRTSASFGRTDLAALKILGEGQC